MNSDNLKTAFKYTLLLAVCGLLYSCANMKSPTGGPQDMLPPIMVKSKPEINSKNFNGDKVEIEFDELIQLKDQNEKVVISPAQKVPAQIRSNGKKVTVHFKDSLIPGTTYTIDFSNSICDYNEENPLENFAFAFSTGNIIDTLQISGILLNAKDLEPMQNMIVGVHSNLSDTAFTNIPLEKVARTNDKGEFTIRNLKPGKYNLFAVNDIDRNFKFTVTEDIAFCDSVLEPKAENIEFSDTLRTVTHEIDTVRTARGTIYTPNDILLTMFNEEVAAQYLVKNERQDSIKLYLQFATKADTLPEFELLDFKNLKNWCKMQWSPTNDTISYWLTNPELIKADTIRVALKYLKTDSTNTLKPYNDTILFKKPIQRQVKKKKKHKEDTVKATIYTPFAVTSSTLQDLHLPVRFNAGVPLDSMNRDMIHFSQKVDTLWKELELPEIKREFDCNLTSYIMAYKWEPGTEYKLLLDSAAIKDIKGQPSKMIEHKFKVKMLEDYSDIYFNVNVKDSAFVEILDSSEKIIRRSPVEDGVAEFNFINPGNYYARLVLDKNNNGIYDTGSYKEKRQPEEVYYYNKCLNIKKNWEITENWDIYATPVNLQKPENIKKNKPEPKKWQLDKNKNENKNKRNGEEDEFYDDNPFGANQYEYQRNPFEENNYNNNDRY